MNGSDWRKLRPVFSNQVSTGLDALGRWRRQGLLTWIQQYPDVVQTLMMQKMKSDNVRVSAFVTTKDGVTLGGNLTRTTIGGGGVAGPDYYWPVRDEAAVANSAKSIVATVADFVVPWFRAFSCANRVHEAHELIPQHYSWAIEYSEFFDPTTPTLELDQRAKEWLPPRELSDYIGNSIEDTLSGRGAERVGDGLTWVRRRREIYDAIHIIPFNYATQVYCLSYNWISELSPYESGEFSDQDTVALVGGAVKTTVDDEAQILRAFPVATKTDRQDSATTLQEVLIHQVDTVLPQVKDKQRFLALAKEKYPRIAEAYGL